MKTNYSYGGDNMKRRHILAGLAATVPALALPRHVLGATTAPAGLVPTAAGPFAEYGNIVDSWTPASNGVNGVQITVIDDGFGPGVDRVEVKIPRTGDKLFIRLNGNL